jgi:hypothetical protein
MKLSRRTLAPLFSALLLGATTLRAQSETPRRWFDVQGAIAHESYGGSNNPQTTTAFNLTLAGTFPMTGNSGFQLAGDYVTDVGGNSNCGVNPFNGGCITGVGSSYARVTGVAAAFALFTNDGRAPTWTGSLGAGPYWVGRSGQSPSLGVRFAVEGELVGGKNAALTATGGALFVPSGANGPVSLFRIGLGLRVW